MLLYKNNMEAARLSMPHCMQLAPRAAGAWDMHHAMWMYTCTQNATIYFVIFVFNLWSDFISTLNWFPFQYYTQASGSQYYEERLYMYNRSIHNIIQDNSYWASWHSACFQNDHQLQSCSHQSLPASQMIQPSPSSDYHPQLYWKKYIKLLVVHPL